TLVKIGLCLTVLSECALFTGNDGIKAEKGTREGGAAPGNSGCGSGVVCAGGLRERFDAADRREDRVLSDHYLSVFRRQGITALCHLRRNVRQTGQAHGDDCKGRRRSGSSFEEGMPSLRGFWLEVPESLQG